MARRRTGLNPAMVERLDAACGWLLILGLWALMLWGAAKTGDHLARKHGPQPGDPREPW